MPRNKLGTNLLSAQGYIEAKYKSNNAFGDSWNATLDRIDWAYQKCYEAGMGYVREAMTTWVQVDTYDGQWTQELLAQQDWTAIDRIMFNAKKYNMHLYLCCVWWDGETQKEQTVQQLIDYRIKPVGEFVARRYGAEYKDYFSLEVTNEINATFMNNELTDTWSDAYSRNAMDSRWMDCQEAFYNAVKLGNPNVKVDLVSMSHHTNQPAWQNMVGCIDQLYNAGKINTFDGEVHVHLYPDDNLVKQSGYGNISGGFPDVTSIINKLATYKPNTKVCIGEYGVFWGNAGFPFTTNRSTTIQDSANAITNMYNLCKDNAGVSSFLYWVFWGSSTRYEYQGIEPGIGMHDMGLFDEVTHEPYVTYTAMKNLNLPVQPIVTITKPTLTLSQNTLTLSTTVTGSTLKPQFYMLHNNIQTALAEATETVAGTWQTTLDVRGLYGSLVFYAVVDGVESEAESIFIPIPTEPPYFPYPVPISSINGRYLELEISIMDLMPNDKVYFEECRLEQGHTQKNWRLLGEAQLISGDRANGVWFIRKDRRTLTGQWYFRPKVVR